MPLILFLSRHCLRVGWSGVLAAGLFVSGAALAREPADIIGQWDVTRGSAVQHCRITLNSERAEKGYFVGIPVPCRRLMPFLAKAGYWNLANDGHLALTDRAGRPALDLSSDGDGFSGQGSDGASYRFTFVPVSSRDATGIDPITDGADATPPAVLELAATKKSRVAAERPSDLAGRYAILRDKNHDTGCMLTLDDKTHVKGGERAALAPACRDQGIVVFDPAAWQIVKGRLVLTAKAGHTTHLDRQEDGSWTKDPSEGKSLTLKKL